MGCRNHARLTTRISVFAGHEEGEGLGSKLVHRLVVLRGDDPEALDGVAGKMGGNIGRAFTIGPAFGLSTLGALPDRANFGWIKHRTHPVDDVLQCSRVCRHRNCTLRVLSVPARDIGWLVGALIGVSGSTVANRAV